MNDRDVKKCKKKPLFDYRETEHSNIKYSYFPNRDLLIISERVVNEIQYSPIDKYWIYWNKVGQNNLKQCLTKVPLLVINFQYLVNNSIGNH